MTRYLAVTVLSALALLFLLVTLAVAAPCRGIAGVASWYGSESGNRTATGDYFDGSGMTAAMPSRSMLGKHVRVTDMRTGRQVVVLVNDIGPARRLHRVIDLSRAAARRLGIIGRGTALVCISRAH